MSSSAAGGKGGKGGSFGGLTFTPAVPKFLQGMLQPKKKEPVKLAMPDVDDDEGDDLPTVGPALDPRLCCASLPRSESLAWKRLGCVR